jgi:hypothetical protein
MRAAVRRLREHLGRRGIALVLLGAGKVCYGLGFIFTSGPNPPGLEALTRWADIRWWAFIWVACGVVTFGCAWLRVGRDGLGFIAAMIPPFVWGAGFLWGAVIGEFMRGLPTFGWYATSHIGMILWASGVPEHSVPHPAPRRAPR